MTITQLRSERSLHTTATPPPLDRTVDWRRLRGAVALWSLVACAVASVGTALGSVVAGQLAQHATAPLVWLLTVCIVGAGLLDTAARTLWAGVVDRAEGRLRADLLDA